MLHKIFGIGRNIIIRKKGLITFVLLGSIMITICLVNIISPYLKWTRNQVHTIKQPNVLLTASEKGELDKRGIYYLNAKKCLNSTVRDIATYFIQTTFKSNTDKKSSSTTKSLTPNCRESVFLIILVTSNPHNFIRRAAARLSWARSDSLINKEIMKNQKQFTWKTFFALGNTQYREIAELVEKESNEYKDILQLPYTDTYENLTNKTILSLGWIADNCKPKFVLKTDDDCFVNILQLLPWLYSLPLSYQYIGKVHIMMPVLRDPQHRNYVSFNDYTEDVYKPYCAGGGYILSGSVLKNISERAKSIKQIINEDAYMGMLTNSLGIIPHHEEKFLPYIYYEDPERAQLRTCDYYSQFLIHGTNERNQLVLYWNSIALNSFQSLCEKL